MSGPMSVFDIAGRAMSAHMLRLNTTASNLANANSVSSSKATAFRAIKPVYETVSDRAGVATVRVREVVATNTQPTMRHAPDHPLADKDGNVWDAGVDPEGEMVEMLETARHYQNMVQVLQTAKDLTVDTIRMGK